MFHGGLIHESLMPDYNVWRELYCLVCLQLLNLEFWQKGDIMKLQLPPLSKPKPITHITRKWRADRNIITENTLIFDKIRWKDFLTSSSTFYTRPLIGSFLFCLSSLIQNKPEGLETFWRVEGLETSRPHPQPPYKLVWAVWVTTLYTCHNVVHAYVTVV